MKNIFFIYFLFLSFLLTAQKTIYKSYKSGFLGDVRDVRIHLPEGYHKNSISNYPLAIVLDGENLFDLYVGMAEFYAKRDQSPKQIVVGIFNKKTRAKDVSYNPTDSKLTANSSLFYNFIRDEIIPYVEANYRTSPFLTIVGDNYSANFLTYFLREDLPIFNAYICLNPSIATNTNNLIQKYNLRRYDKLDNTFYFYIAGNPFSDIERQENTTNFVEFMKSIDIKNLNVVYDDMGFAKSSTSSVAEGLSRSFTKIFEIYSRITKDEFETKIKNLSPPDAIAYLEIKYLDIQFLFGANIGIRKRDIVAIEDIIIDQEDGDYLEDFGKMILKLHPSSEMGNYYLGRYHESGQDYESALEEYRIGYGKIDSSDPNANLYYKNIERILDIIN